MIPTPRPSLPHGACQDCGTVHQGECHLAEMDRNREIVDEMAKAIDVVATPTHMPMPPIRWRNATAEEVAVFHGMPLWVAERMVADRLAGSIRGAGGQD